MFRISAFSIAISLVSFQAFGQEAPNEEQLARGIAEQIPAWMRVDDVEITATANSGDSVSPLTRNRLIASVSTRENLYTQGYLPENLTQFAPSDYVLISVVTEAGSSISLYGVSQSYLSMGDFRIEFEFENLRSINSLGKPKSFFAPSALTVGSEETDIFYAEIQKRAAEDEKRLEDLRASLIERLPGEWKGEYVSGQGITGMTVTINTIAAPQDITGVFHFYGTERSSNDVPNGKYEIKISYNDAEDGIVAQPSA